MNRGGAYNEDSQLLMDRRFFPLFCTQFLGAFNDNILKNALLILIALKAWSVSGIEAAQMVRLSAGLFIAPFFLFSAREQIKHELRAGNVVCSFPEGRLSVDGNMQDCKPGV